MNDVASRYDKDILIAETAFPFTTEPIKSDVMIFTEELAGTVPYRVDPERQREFMLDLMYAIRSVKNGRGIGFFYWEPTWINLAEARWATEEGKMYLNKNSVSGNVWANLALFDYNGHSLPALQASYVDGKRYGVPIAVETITLLALGLQTFITNQFAANWTLFAAAAVLSSLPIMAMFLFMQRFLQNGLATTGTQG